MSTGYWYVVVCSAEGVAVTSGIVMNKGRWLSLFKKFQLNT
jgi:hypothetical protein